MFSNSFHKTTDTSVVFMKSDIDYRATYVYISLSSSLYNLYGEIIIDGKLLSLELALL